jgi:hypothetical protein
MAAPLKMRMFMLFPLSNNFYKQLPSMVKALAQTHVYKQLPRSVQALVQAQPEPGAYGPPIEHQPPTSQR